MNGKQVLWMAGTVRQRLIRDAVTLLEQARADLGISPTFVLGEGNLLF